MSKLNYPKRKTKLMFDFRLEAEDPANVCATVANAVEVILQSRKKSCEPRKRKLNQNTQTIWWTYGYAIGMIVNSSIVC